MAVQQFIGARYVPVFADPVDWNDSRTYEPLTIVLHGGNSYTSKQYVPKGIDIDNEDFWVLTANYNSQVELYRKETSEAVNTSKQAENTAKAAVENVAKETERATGAEENLKTSIGEVKNDISAETSRAEKVEDDITSLINLKKNRGGSISLMFVGSANTPSTNNGEINWSVQSICAKDEKLIVGVTNYNNQRNVVFITIDLESNTQYYTEKTLDFSCHMNSIYWDDELKLYIVSAGNEEGKYIAGFDSSFNLVKTWPLFSWAFDRDPITGKRYSWTGTVTDSVINELDNNFNVVATYPITSVEQFGVAQSFRVVDGVFYFCCATGITVYTIDEGVIATYNVSNEFEVEGIAFNDGRTFFVGNPASAPNTEGIGVFMGGLDATSIGTQTESMPMISNALLVNTDSTFWFKTGAVHTLKLPKSIINSAERITIDGPIYYRTSGYGYFTLRNKAYLLATNQATMVCDINDATLEIYCHGQFNITNSENANLIYHNAYSYDIVLGSATKLNATPFTASAEPTSHRMIIRGLTTGLVNSFGWSGTLNENTSVTVPRNTINFIASHASMGYPIHGVVSYKGTTRGIEFIGSTQHGSTFSGIGSMDGKLIKAGFYIDPNANTITLAYCTVNDDAASLVEIG